ncbi:sensor histidine kinase [Winogradskyella endarachnes]|uniref:histidine kinase n=1 Tax=Winogradskyella endarachnes TaxID=2681965 RepID=A0A6L6U5K1_9FLAO|nr:ATP-binding protein [Winogradskyella endarachnes]MUU77485.1 PAS domain-containing protein [Winogradskyella endarachnes]
MKSTPFYRFLKKPLVISVITIIALLAITQYVAYQKYLINENEQRKELNNEINIIKDKLQALIMYNYSATKSLAYIVERNGIPSDFDEIAKDFLNHQNYFDAIELVDSTGVITHVYPLEGNDVIGFNILSSKAASQGAYATIESKDFFIAGPVNLKQGGVGIISRQPIFIDNKFFGFSAIVTKLSTFLEDLNIAEKKDNRFYYQLSRVNSKTGEEQFFLENKLSVYQEYAVPIEMSFGEWKLYVVPINRKVNSAFSYSAIGILLALLVGWLVWRYTGQTERYNKILTEKLASQETELKLIHKKAEKQIKKSELDLNRAQRIASIGSWEYNLKTKRLFFSKEMYRIIEKDSEKFKVTRDNYYQILHPEDREKVKIAIDSFLEKKESYNITYRLLLPNDRIKHVNEHCELLLDKKNNLSKSFGTIQDITKRVISENELLNFKINLENLVNQRTEELNDSKEALLNLLEDINLQSLELEKEKAKAQSADAMKSAFLATMSHELRTPMNSIIGFTGILLKELAGPLNEEQKKQLNMVKRSSKNLLDLINDILDISKIEAGKLNVTFSSFNYHTIIDKTIAFFEPQISQKGLKLVTDIKNDQITVYSDERRLEQVLINLITNAIKFSEKGTIIVKVYILEDYVVTEVIDQGIGIKAKEMNKLFQPFVQIEGGLSRKHEGTGLGLTISKSLIEKLGGTIRVESEIGKGSNFTFTIPQNKVN